MKKVLGYLLCFIGIACIIFAGIYQAILSYQMFGFILSGDTTFFIPHWSALFYLGAIPLFFGYVLVKVSD